MKDLIRKFKGISTTVIGIMTIDAYRRSVIGDSVSEQLKTITTATELKAKELEAIQSNLAIKEEKLLLIHNKVSATQGRIMEKVDSLIKNRERLSAIIKEKAEGNDAIIDGVQKDSVKILNEITKELSDLDSSINIEKVVKGITESDNSTKFVGEYWDYIQSTLDNLNTAQLGSLGYILFSIALCYCVYSIAVVYYGDKLIIHFKLEEKYPRLAVWIKYRRTLQHYSIGLNLLIILIIAGYMAFVNISIFKYL